jgi:hypothetical protein
LFLASLSAPIGGVLDLFGRSTIVIPVPPDPVLRGLRFYTATAVLDPAGGFAATSNDVAIRIAR